MHIEEGRAAESLKIEMRIQAGSIAHDKFYLDSTCCLPLTDGMDVYTISDCEK